MQIQPEVEVETQQVQPHEQVPAGQVQDHASRGVPEGESSEPVQLREPVVLHSPNQVQPHSRWPQTPHHDHCLLRRLTLSGVQSRRSSMI